MSIKAITIKRGQQDYSLYKSDELFSLRMRSGFIPPDPFRSGMFEGVHPNRVRMIRREPSQNEAVFSCAPGELDGLMARFRSNPDVAYCSHVYSREERMSAGLEILVDDKIFVEFAGPPDRTLLRQFGDMHGIRALWRPETNGRGVVFQLTDQAGENPLKISRNMDDSVKGGLITTAEPCLISSRKGRAVPGDRGFPRQWHLLNTGQGGGTPGADCNAAAAWDVTWGDPEIVVAVIDDGFDLDHPDLVGKWRDPFDATGGDFQPLPEYGDNHGTACAGVAVAGRGGGRTVGVAPDCSLMPIRHAGRLGDYQEAQAFKHAFEKGADVISCSWGPYDAYSQQFQPMSSLTRTVVDLCATKGRDGRGIPIFFAAGNGNEPLDLDGYANHHNVIAVAASTNLDDKAWYSDYGPNVWVCAPSSGGTLGIYTVDRTGEDGYAPDSDYTADFGGTSSATPLVAGVAALMLSVNPALTVAEVKEILKETAAPIRIDAPREYKDFWGDEYSDAYDAQGHSPVFGWGRIDAGMAVALAQSAHFDPQPGSTLRLPDSGVEIVFTDQFDPIRLEEQVKTFMIDKEALELFKQDVVGNLAPLGIQVRQEDLERVTDKDLLVTMGHREGDIEAKGWPMIIAGVVVRVINAPSPAY